MSLNLNKAVIAGNITRDLELKQTASGIAFIRFTVAVRRRFTPKNADGTPGEAQTDFIEVSAWRQQAEFVARYFHKGSPICVVGSIQTRNWVDAQNIKHYATEVSADEINFVESRGDSGNYASAPSAPASDSGNYTPSAYGSGNTPAAPSYSSSAEAAPKFEEIKGDDDLPF